MEIESKDNAATVQREAARVRTPSSIVWRKLLRHGSARFGAFILLALVILSVFAPAFATHEPFRPGPNILDPPSREHFLGTDQHGRDIFTRILYGSRISLTLGFISITIATITGVPLGLVAGYFGGRVDWAISRLADLMLAFPPILLALLVVSILGPSLYNAMIAIGVAAIPSRIRLARSVVLSEREKMYVESARSAGMIDLGIIWRHIFPATFSPLIVLSTVSVGTAILMGSTLSYLGLGAQPPTPEWGAMLGAGRNYMSIAWWMTLFPGIAVSMTVIGVNLLGDALRDSLDVKLD